MKGRLYKPSKAQVVLSTEPTERNQPWFRDPEIPRVYMWESSIPEKWLKIKGKDAFQHVSESGNNKNTLEFLANNQKYIGSIAADPRTKPASRNPSATSSQINSRSGSPVPSLKESEHPRRPVSDLLMLPSDNLTTSQQTVSRQSQLNNPDLLRLAVKYGIPDTGKKLTSISSMKNFAIDIPERNTHAYLVNKYSLPKLLVPVKKNKRANQVVGFKNNGVQQFLDRFGKDQGTLTQRMSRKGVNGWKLVNLKKAEGKSIR